jgi:hypothetical protein
MRREELGELHYITPIENVQSISQLGILCNRESRRLKPKSIAKKEVQDLRAKIQIPGGRRLHDYANLYFCARNPMMFLRAALHQSTCILRVSPNVLDLPGVVITDQNAASNYRLFLPSPSGLKAIDRDMVFADDWRHPGNAAAFYRHRSVKCAEVLVPDRVPALHIVGAYVSCPAAERAILEQAPALCVAINDHLFFR